MPPRTSRFLSTLAFLFLLTITTGECQSVEGDAAKLDELTSNQDWDGSIEFARKITSDPDQNDDLTYALARLARGLQNAGKVKIAAEFYQLAVDSSQLPTASNLTASDRTLIHLAASEVMVQSQNIPAAIALLAPLLDGASDPVSAAHETETVDTGEANPTISVDPSISEQQKKIAVWVLLRAGSASLSRGAALDASTAYSLALRHADQQQRPLALLGDAWATAVRDEKSAAAVSKLSDFVDQYPDHKDAPNAARGCAQCLKRMGREADSTAMLSDLLHRWPNSEAALEVIRNHGDLSPTLIPSAVQFWVITKAKANDLKSFDTRITRMGLLIAADKSELVAWANLASHLAIIDTTGQTTSDVLKQLETAKLTSDAEQLAVQFISPTAETPVTTAAREAACRWAGRTSRWSMLAVASEAEDLSSDDPTRTLSVERLFAEALTQTGQTKLAHAWWVHLADVRATGDFRILIRCAETETSHGNDSRLAEERIAAARVAAGDNATSINLVKMLEAELAIRRSNFDDARGILEVVIRSTEPVPELRGRAQWLIGETWYMQRQYKNAIDAYRKVEAIDKRGTWTAAAFLQAGKAFEQLGGIKEATLCYVTLLNRFPETQYAAPAQNRLAALSNNESRSSFPSSPPTIRR